MIKTFDDYMKDNKNTNGIQTFDNYVKANNLKISSTIASPNVTTKKKTNWLSKTLDVVYFASNPTKGMTNLMTKQAQKGVSDGAKILNDIRIGNTSVISKPNSNATGLEKAVTTGLNTNKLFVENMMKSVEGTIDTGASLLSGTGKVLGANTSKIDNFIKKNLTQNSLDYIFGKGNKEKGRKLQEQADENSYITNKDLAGQVVSAVGGQVPTILASGIAQGSGLSDKNVERVNKLTFGSKVYGNSMEEALNNGASFKDATKYAVGSTAVEIASEWLTGGIPGTNGKGALDNLAGKLIGEPIEKASSSLSKAILKYGYRMVGEASEEMLSEFLQPFVEQLTYKYENSKSLTGNLKEGLNNVSVEDILIAGITGALSAGILDAPVSFSDISQAKRNKTNTNINSNLENNTTTEEIIKSNTNTGSSSNIAHTSSNVVQNLNNQEESITERLEKRKQLEEITKQNKKYDKINETLEEYENIQEKQNETIQNIENSQNNLIEQIQQQNNLTIDEQNELSTLKKTDLAIGLDEKENARLNYLEKKQNGLIKYPDLIGKNSYENIKSNYWHYKNSLDSYNPTLYNKIKEVTPSYRNTGRMTKNEWLGLAKNVGANFKGDSQSLEKYAVQTWFYASPQNNLNRQGKKFVKFDIGEWLTSFYEGAGVGTEINEPTKANTNAQVNYSMPNLPMSSYNYVESNNTKINELRKSASQYLNSSEKTIRTIDLMEKIIADKGYKIRFNPNITNESGESVNGLITKENGQVTIELNPNANNYVEFLIVHEITHDIATKEMKELILNYAEQDPEFEKSLETLKERYKTDDVSDEVVADVCGELFGNREFIQSVVEKKPNIFMKILNNIRELAKKTKGSNAEEYVSFVEKLKTMWEDAYYSNKSNLSETKYMMTSVKGMQNGIMINNKYQDIKNRYDLALKLEKTGNYTNEEIRRKTNWFKNKKGDWEFEISDCNTKFKIKPKENMKYSLSDIFEAKTLYEMYPGLKNVTVKFENIKGNGSYNRRTNTIKLRNMLINNYDGLRGTLLHEIQHYIQYEENLPTGTTILFGNEQYADSLGEIEAADTKNRRNLTVEERKNIIPESAKSNPVHPNRDAILNHKRGMVEKIAEKLYNLLGDKTNEVFEKNDTKTNEENFSKNNENYSERFGFGRKYDVKGLDNSSFSLEQRVSGDELLDTQDLIEEIKSVGAKVDKNGYVTLYHQTTNENADKIRQTGKMFAKEPYVYFSTSENASQSDGRGNTKLEFKIPAEKLILDDIFSDNADVKIKLNSNKELDVSNYIISKNRNSASNNHKQKQLDIIKNNNPDNDDYHTWIRNVEDIKTLEETINDSDWIDYNEYNPDLSKRDIENAIESGKITIYSSYPIRQGVFVSPSKMEAESYSGNGKVYSKEVNINDVAWIDPTQGQYAKVYDVLLTKYSQSTKEWNEYLKENFPSAGTKTKMSDINLPTREDIQNSSKKSKILNPNEISKLTKEDANTTPNLPNYKKNKYNDGKSKFAKNVENKVNMLSEEQKNSILSEDDVKFYDKVTNKESLEKAYKRLEKNGTSETLEWFNKDPKNANSIDVAEGWILLKQYADNNDALGMKNVAKKLRNIGTIAGQTVQAFNIMERMTPEGMVVYAQSELDEAYDKMVKNKTKEWINKHRSEFDLTPEETQTIMNIMDEVKNMEDGYEKRVKLAEIQKLMTDKLPPERGAGIKAWMRISMLFNPKTQVRNILGNAVIAPTNAFSDLFASGVDKMISKKTNVRTTGVPNLKSYGKGFKAGLYQSYNDFKKGINTRNIEGNRFEITQGKSFNDKNVIGKNLNRVDNLLSFMLDAGDRGFYEASFTNSINNQMILNKTNKITQEMIDIATSEALSRTWQDNNNYTKFVLQTRNALNKINVKGYGLGDILIPFAKTPANLTKAIVDYSPVGLINAINSGVNLKNSLENGQFTPQMQHEFVQNLGKATAGTMLYIIGLALAKAGITSGESDDDKDTRNFMKNTLGINSYSIKIGGKTFTYDWAQPIAAPLSITANIEKNRKENASTLESIISSLDTAGNILLEQSFMDSINTVLNNNDGIVTGMQEAILELPSRAIPTFSKQIVDLTDSTQRQTFEYNSPLKTSVNKIKAKIPGLSKQLAPSVDTMGRDIQKYGGKNNVFNVFLNPANVNSENLSESASEIYRLYKETGDTTLMPRVSPYYINKNGEKTILTSEQRADYQKTSGKIIEDNVKNLLKSRTYNSLSDEEKADVINNIVNYSYNIAQKETLDFDISNAYYKAYQYSKLGNISDYYIIKSQEFTSSKDKNGKTISGSKKAKVINYINSMNIPVSQKAILINLNGYKLTNYNSKVINYVNSSNNTTADKKEILKSLGFEVYTKNGKTYVK